MFNILEVVCTSDVNSCCSDYGIATYLYIMKRILNIIHIIVPIVLMVMVAVNLTQLMMDPDDQKKIKMNRFKNKIIAAVIVFFIPYIMNLTVEVISYSGLSPEDFNLAGCYRAADDTTTIMHETEEYDAMSPIKRQKLNLDIDIDLNDTSELDNDGKTKGTKKGKQIVKYAKKFIGNKYVWGGTSLTNGTDCSGFTMRVYEKFGYSLPRTSGEQAKAGKEVTALKDAQAGDLIHYDGHIAIYEGNGKIVHASNRRDGIKESSATYRPILDIRRII